MLTMWRWPKTLSDIPVDRISAAEVPRREDAESRAKAAYRIREVTQEPAGQAITFGDRATILLAPPTDWKIIVIRLG